ncbi:hypothetical protein KO561_18095 [Radiobacillus kanasensis]|nr:hypothetical protein [Radiobacillus kanasensis]UFT99072.1 hypothetical protein KO561_18095 [Radiobacillus kanasensis]
MRKLLMVVFLLLITSFGVIGYVQNQIDAGGEVNQETHNDDQSEIIQ